LYRRRIRAFWFTALAFYDGAGSPLAAAVGDIIAGKVEFSSPDGSFVAPVENLGQKSLAAPEQNEQTERRLFGDLLDEAPFPLPNRLSGSSPCFPQ